MNRRSFLYLGLNAIIGAGYVYPRYIERFWPEISVVPVELSKLRHSGVRILHLSDLHYSESMPLSYIESALQIGLASNPDIICVTGDFTTHHVPEISAYAAVLKKLSAAAPTFAVLGNHDGGAWSQTKGFGYDKSDTVRKILDQAQIECLHNTSTTVSIRGQRIVLSGVGDLWTGETDGAAAFSNVERRDDPVILLAHNPDSKDLLSDFDWDLMLSGHTHGGTIRVPFTGATPYAPVKDHRYISGLCPWGEKLIHVNRGIGDGFGWRFNCRPEISVLDLRAA